jgi:RNA polymerase sigma-70 factor (ECF subfamily)
VTDLTQNADQDVNAQVESVIRAHASDVEGILIRMGFPRWAARPAVNDALLALAQERKRGTHVANPKAFLVKVAIFRARNALRPLREKNEIPGSDVISDMPDRTDDFTVAVMVQMDVRRGLGQLSQRQREALTLCDLAGLSYGEAATHMGISADGVESNLRRGRKRLKQIMLEHGYQPRKHEQGDQPGKEATR